MFPSTAIISGRVVVVLVRVLDRVEVLVEVEEGVERPVSSQVHRLESHILVYLQI